MEEEERDPLSSQVIGAAIEVHKLLGPGLLESIYHRVPCHELTLRDIPFASKPSVRVDYKGVDLGDDLEIDILVADRLILELKAVERLLPLHDSQLTTYLKLTKLSTGLLINFNVRLLKDGIKRIVP